MLRRLRYWQRFHQFKKELFVAAKTTQPNSLTVTQRESGESGNLLFTERRQNTDEETSVAFF
jgi:hypothetical protein